MAFNYYDPIDLDYSLYFYVAANVVNNDGGHTAHLNASIFTNFNDFTASISFNYEGSPFLCEFNENVDFLGKKFESVYSSIPLEGVNKFSELHFSNSLGIIAFKDKDNILWVFDRFE